MRFIFCLIVFTLIGCSSNKEISNSSPYPIESVYFQHWLGGQEQTGSGTNFHLQFKNELSQNITLAKVYFQKKEGFFEKVNPTTFVALFYNKPNNPDLIFDGDTNNEYGNKVPEITEPRFKLKDNEAILEFHIGTKIELYKIVDIIEKELIAYPSAPPRK